MYKLLNSKLKKQYIYIMLILLVLLMFLLFIFIYKNEINSSLTAKASDSITYETHGDYTISLVRSSSTNTNNVFQSVYAVIITCNSNIEPDNNLLQLELPVKAKLTQHWYGDFEYKDNNIYITSLTYSKIDDGIKKASCGFTLESDSEINVKSIKVHYNNDIYTATN